eukprot:COSAG01_NODE_8905_length_2620_cov_50.763189_1_plen_92_part_10
MADAPQPGEPAGAAGSPGPGAAEADPASRGGPKWAKDKKWADMDESQRRYVQELGWSTASSWDGRGEPPFETQWSTLSEDQQHSAQVLGLGP